MEKAKVKSDAWPFVCEGNPYESQIFLVGINPATPIDIPFWEFWDDNYGMNMEKYLDNHKKVNEGEFGKTRKRIMMKFRDPLERNGMRILETNIWTEYAKEAESVRNKNIDVLEFLLRELNPKIIVVHGNKAHKGILKIKPPYTVKVIKATHFSRIPNKEIGEICRRILQLR